MKEVWKNIDGFPGYQISSLGNVRSFRDNHGNISSEYTMLKLKLNKDDYYQICLYTLDHKKVHRRIHRLVLDAFIGPRPDMVCNHINGDKHDNRLENLEWVTAKENSTLAAQNGLYKTKTIRVIETGEVFNSIVECADVLGVSANAISCQLCDKQQTVNGLHFEILNEYYREIKEPFLRDYQYDAVKKAKNGCIFNGGVGSGKSRTGLYYYFSKFGGDMMHGKYIPMKNPCDLYIITTAAKRDKKEWEEELLPFLLYPEPYNGKRVYKNKVYVDSWQNIKKYTDVKNAQFIFDEDHVTGNGTWVKAFYKITANNDWFILSATAGDSYIEYAPVFIANGFYKNITEFRKDHVIYSRYTKYPKIDRYINTGRLERIRRNVLVDMPDRRQTTQYHEDIFVNYDIQLYKDIFKNRWNLWENRPIETAAELCYLLRKVVNLDSSRQTALLEILEDNPKVIIFYNYDYELEILRGLPYIPGTELAEWNGHLHQPIPDSERWVYLCHYTSAEGWQCIQTNTIIFFSQNYSYKMMIQAAGRIDRMNTPFNDLYYYHLKSRAGIDLAISKALKQKKKFNESKWVNG